MFAKYSRGYYAFLSYPQGLLSESTGKLVSYRCSVIGFRVPLSSTMREMKKRIKANNPPTIVQTKSVHFLSNSRNRNKNTSCWEFCEVMEFFLKHL